MEFLVPLGDGRTWTLTPIAGFSHWQYNAPDPAIDPNTTPRTNEWRVGLGLDVPIWNKVYMSTLVQYRVRHLQCRRIHDA